MKVSSTARKYSFTSIKGFLHLQLKIPLMEKGAWNKETVYLTLAKIIYKKSKTVINPSANIARSFPITYIHIWFLCFFSFVFLPGTLYQVRVVRKIHFLQKYEWILFTFTWIRAMFISIFKKFPFEKLRNIETIFNTI